ncbi:hypothetical protein MFLAVUS_005693 [Mucor flavus]|uniref:Uncharacterized protein n=1 Tax=Mucor flavus TaxID=439312 RepID=A0ABP9YZF6_9FUNG
MKGSWTKQRKLALLASYRDFRLYGVPYGEVTSQWNAITKAVNNKDPEIKHLGKQAGKDQLDSAYASIHYRISFGPPYLLDDITVALFH